MPVMDASNLPETPNGDVLRNTLHGEGNRVVEVMRAVNQISPLLVEVLTFH